jgi:hypothetical protein
LSRHVNAK